jgi:hypothetical protein
MLVRPRRAEKERGMGDLLCTFPENHWQQKPRVAQAPGISGATTATQQQFGGDCPCL